MTAPAARRPHLLTDVREDARTAWCDTCLERVPIARNGTSWRCAIDNRQRVQAWREADPARAKASKDASVKAHPEPKRQASLRYSSKHRQEIRDKANALREELRRQVIEAYGGRCNCPGCHVVHAELLTVDHVNGDGHAERKSSRSSRDIYRKIVKLGFPPEYQLLCGSCNLAKADRDKCPLAGQDH